jgi:hypothetical protein
MLLLCIHKKIITPVSPQKMPQRSRSVLKELRLGLDSSASGCVLPQDRLEAYPPTPVEIRYALRVLAEQGCFGR